MLVIGLLVGSAFALGGFAKPIDAVAYWEAGTSTRLYPEQWSEVASGYPVLPPPVAQLSVLLQPVGWPLFVVLTVAIFGAFWFCARSASLPLLLIGIPYVFGLGPGEPSKFLEYALLGNLAWILAALVLASMRHPAIYPILLLHEGHDGHRLVVVPRPRGVAGRRSRSHHVRCLLPRVVCRRARPWFDFVAFATRNAGMADPPIPLFPVPFGVRLVMSVALILWGARTERRWTVPIAVGWALPALYSWCFLPFWVAAVRLTDIDRSRVTRWARDAWASARYVMPARPLPRADTAPVLVEVGSDRGH